VITFYTHSEYKDPSKPNVYIIGFYPEPETTLNNIHLTKSRFRALAFTYGISIIICNHPSDFDALPEKLPVISIEEHGDSMLKDFQHPRDVIYLCGNSAFRYPSRYFDTEGTVTIETPMIDHPLYGDQAGAIILQDRLFKNII